jgi:hypothetical protein
MPESERRFAALVAAHLDSIYRTARRLGARDGDRGSTRSPAPTGEGIGVVPDVDVPADEALETAQRRALERLGAR